MSRYMPIALWLLVCSAAPGQEPPARPKPKVELRWLENEPVKDLTEDWGVQTTCGPDRSYPHRKPVLTSEDVAGARLHRADFSSSGLPANLYMVSFQLTEQARKKLADACGDGPTRALAVFIDGTYWGTRYLRKADVAEFAPQAGFMSSKSQAERIVAAFK